MDRHALVTPDVLQSISSYETILVRVRTVVRLVQDRIHHTITEYELTPPPELEDAPTRGLECFKD